MGAVMVVVVIGASGCAPRSADQGALEPDERRTPGSTVPPRPPGLAAPLPSARTEVAGTAWLGRIVVLGGLTADGEASAGVDFYEPADDTWSEGPDLPMALHHTAAVSGPDGRLWVVGGFSMMSGRWVPRKEVWSLAASSMTWRSEPALSEARGALSATSVENLIVAIGGASGDGAAESVSREVEFFEPGTDAWERGPDLFEPREHLAAAMTGDRVLAIGGRAGGLDTNMRSVESWSPGDATWRRESPLQKDRGGIAAATVDGIPCVAGGEEPEQTISFVECLRGGRWRIVGQLEEPRHGLAVAALSGRLHAIGGGPEPGLFVSATHEVLDIGS